jgi:hypothetical protein
VTDFNAGVFHAKTSRPRSTTLTVGSEEFTDEIQEGLLDAFHADYAASIDPGRFLGPKASGCGEFNPTFETPEENRRLTLALYGADAPKSEEFPCERGNAGACEIDDGGAARCRFFRERIHETPTRVEEPFWTFDWIKTPNGKAHLSALTSLPDTDDVRVELVLHGKPARRREAGLEYISQPAIVTAGPRWSGPPRSMGPAALSPRCAGRRACGRGWR